MSEQEALWCGYFLATAVQRVAEAVGGRWSIQQVDSGYATCPHVLLMDLRVASVMYRGLGGGEDELVIGGSFVGVAGSLDSSSVSSWR